MSSINSVNTKLEAYLLVHDPRKLLRMLSLKYSDIEKMLEPDNELDEASNEEK